MEKSLDNLKFLCESFNDDVNRMISNFDKGIYSTFNKDFPDGIFLNRDYIIQNIEKIKEYYSYISLINDIFNHSFVTLIKEIARDNDYEYNNSYLDAYPKELLAVDLAIHNPISRAKTYDHSDFWILNLKKTVVEKNRTMMYLKLIFLLNIKTIDMYNLESITVNDCDFIIKQINDLSGDE